MGFYAITGLINTIASALFGFFVILKNRKAGLNKTFAVFCLSVAIWSSGYFFWQIAENPQDALFIFRILMIGAIFIPVCYFHFVISLVDLLKEKRKLIIFGYLLSFVFFFLNFTSLFIEGMENKLSFPFWPRPGVAFHPFLAMFFGFTIYSWHLMLKIRRQSDDIKRKQIEYVFWGTLIGFIGGSTNYFLWYNIPIPPIGNFLVVLYPIALGYAVLKHHLFNLKVIATELLVFAIWTATLIDLLMVETWQQRLIKGGLFVFIIIFGIFLIKSVRKEVSQREKIEKLAQELKTANEKLVETDKIKAGMYSFVSHQIKSPIGIIKGFAQFISEGAYGEIPDKVKETADNIKKSADRLIKLVEDFLDLRRMEEGKMDYQFADMNIVDLAQSVVAELRILAENKGLKLIFEPAEKEIKIKADDQRLRQVIQNLIENAIKYTEKGFVKVEINTGTSDVQKLKLISGTSDVLITVSDSGMGIVKDVLSTIFDQFKRAQAARTIKGSGLGLYIAKQIVEAHKGEIWAESDGEGKGSRFYVRLPAD